MDLNPTKSNLQELNEIIDVTLKSPMQHEYDFIRRTVTIKAIFMKSSDILPFVGDKSIEKFNVVVVDTFHIDCDLNLISNKEVELNILAHTWNIRQAAAFRLNGADGETATELPKTDGTAGRPGSPGENGGNFFGFATIVINGRQLLVEVNGGKGGNGQGGRGSVDFGSQFETINYEYFPVLKFLRTSVEDILRQNGFDRFENDEDKIEEVSCLGAVIRKHFKYTIYPKRCCGKTGRGGEGMIN